MYQEGDRRTLAKLERLDDCEATRLRQLGEDTTKDVYQSTLDSNESGPTGNRKTKHKRLKRRIGYRIYHLRKASRISLIGILIFALLALLVISPVVCMYVACFAFVVLLPMAQAAYWLFERDCPSKNGSTHRGMINLWLGRDERSEEDANQSNYLDSEISK